MASVKVDEQRIPQLSKEIPLWKIVTYHHLERQFSFQNFLQALEFVGKVGVLAEGEGHHPDILIHDYNKVKLTLYTHTIGGLSEKDFILAQKIDKIK